MTCSDFNPTLSAQVDFAKQQHLIKQYSNRFIETLNKGSKYVTQ